MKENLHYWDDKMVAEGRGERGKKRGKEGKGRRRREGKKRGKREVTAYFP